MKEAEVFAEGRFSTLVNALKFRLYNHFTRNSSPLFLKGGDSISTPPILIGGYERELIALIKRLAESGYSDTLIDIGANVGLTAFYAHPFFRVTHCFEPNPRVFCVLKANLFEGVDKQIHLHNVAIGEKAESATLTIPRHNYGGAFILNPGNAYTLEELAHKDGFARFDQANYETINIEVAPGREVLRPLFAQARGSVLIKIDAEGFEVTILKEIAAALPPGLRFAIAFENWGKNFSPEQFAKTHFTVPVNVFKLASTLDESRSRFGKLKTLLVRGRRYRLRANPHSWVGTVLFTDASTEIV